MLDNIPPYVVPAPVVTFEGFTNFETWYVCLILNNDKRLYDRYHEIFRQHALFSDKQTAIEMFVKTNKRYFENQQGIDLKVVNWEELTTDLCTE